MKEHKLCPFCGRGPYTTMMGPDNEWKCANQKCPIYGVKMSDTAWNTRPSPWIPINRLPERKDKEDFAGDFLMAPFTSFKCCTYGGGMNHPPIGFYDFRNKRWIITGASNSYTPTHYRPMPTQPEKGQV